MTEPQWNVLDYSSFTIADTANKLPDLVGAGFSGAKPAGTQCFIGTLETAPVRMRGDDADPTASEGELRNPGDSIVLSESEYARTRFIRTGGVSAVIKGHFYDMPAAIILSSTAPRFLTVKSARTSEVKCLRATTTSSNTTVKAAIAAVSGKKIRLIAMTAVWGSTATVPLEVYFDTGANIATTASQAITLLRGDTDVMPSTFFMSWPDGAGPIGGEGQQVSFRNVESNNDIWTVIFQYREEED